MAGGSRSPFGNVLRTYRQDRGWSQSALADRIVERGLGDPAFASLGVVSDKTIANLERTRAKPSEYVRPRPQTVKILAAALDLAPGSPEERAFFAAAEETRSRLPVRHHRKQDQQRPLFVRAGREEQFNRLNEAWHRASNGLPQFVLLAGDAGTGKTHMIRECCMGIQQQSGEVRVVWGECSPGALAVEPFLPMLQAMNMLLGLVTREDDPAIPSEPILHQQVATIETLFDIAPALIGSFVDEQALTAQVERLAAEHPQLDAGLQRALGVRTATDSSGRLEQLARFLAASAANAPIVLVLEDLHWANDHIVAMLLQLHRQLRDQHGVSLLVIGSYRTSDILPQQGERHPLERAINELSRLSTGVVIDLNASIGSDRGLAFINTLTRGLHLDTPEEEPLARFLFERTEGHPLFAIELIRWLRDTGKLDQEDASTWHVDLQSLDDAAPSRIQAVIAERLDRLPAGLREVIEGAAVQGTTVTIDIIPNTSELTGDQVAEAVEEQIAPRYRLLSPTDPITIAGKRLHRYQFRHMLFQQYIYEALAPSRRERLHARTAEKMIALLGDDPHAGSGEIAFHFAQAHRTDEAATFAWNAGSYALQQLNYDVADYWFRQAEHFALELNDDRRVLAARNGLIAALRGSGNSRQAVALARDILAENRRNGFKAEEAQASDLLGVIYYDIGELHKAITCLQAAADIHRTLGHHASASGSESMLSHTYNRLGAYDDALHHARIARESARLVNHTAFEAEALLALANCENELGRYDAAIPSYAEARRAYTHVHEIRGEVICDLNTGFCLSQLGQTDQAIPLLKAARNLTRTLQAPRLQSIAAYYLGRAFLADGDLASAEAALTEALAIRRRLEQGGANFDPLTTLLRIAIVRHDREAIANYLRPLLRWLEDHNGDGIEYPFDTWLAMADAYIEIGSDAGARSALRDGHAALMQRASRISDPASRASYLANVPAHRELVERYAASIRRAADD